MSWKLSFAPDQQGIADVLEAHQEIVDDGGVLSAMRVTRWVVTSVFKTSGSMAVMKQRGVGHEGSDVVTVQGDPVAAMTHSHTQTVRVRVTAHTRSMPFS